MIKNNQIKKRLPKLCKDFKYTKNSILGLTSLNAFVCFTKYILLRPVDIKTLIYISRISKACPRNS